MKRGTRLARQVIRKPTVEHPMPIGHVVKPAQEVPPAPKKGPEVDEEIATQQDDHAKH